MNDAAYVDYGPQITPVTSSPLWAEAPAGMEQYWGWNDPRWGSWGRTPESMKYPINDIWDKLLRQSGFSGDIYTSKEVEAGIGFDGQPYYGSIPDYTPEAKAGIDRLRAAGYDVRQKHPDRRTFNTYYGLVTPGGEVQDIKIEGSDLGDMIMPLIKTWGAGLGLASLGAGLNSLLGGAGAGAAPANALAGGIGGVEGAAFADLAGGMLPEFGTIPAYSAGLGGGAGVLTAADLAALPADELGQVVPTPAGVEDISSISGGTLQSDFVDASGSGAGAEGAGAGGGGTEALSALDQAALDMGAGATNVGAATGGGSDLDKILTFLKSPAGASALSGLGSLLGGVIQAGAAEGASEQQAEAARNALALSREMFEYQKNLLAPYQKYGTAALERLSGALGLEGAAKSQQMLEMDPGYGFRLGEGLKALERMQAARGSMLSGGAMKAGQRYAQDYASGEYGNAYNRLANIAGLGQTAGTQLGNAASQFSTNAGNVMGQEANALAAGRIGRGSAYGNAIQGGLNAYSNYLNQQQQNQLFRDIFGRTAIGN